jgi:allantoicase
LRESIDLASDRLRGYVLAANDESVSSREHLVKDDPPCKEDGWVTKRRRDGGFDWAIVRLGTPGVVEEVVIDTTGFTGNYPPEASVEGCVAPHNALPEELSDWTEIVCRSTLTGDGENSFGVHLKNRFTHIRLNIFPDGGVARLRVFGRPVPNWMAPGFQQSTCLDLAAAVNGGHVYSASDMHYGKRQNLLMPSSPLKAGDGWGTRRRRESGHDWAAIRLVGPGTIQAVTLDTAYFHSACPGKASMEASLKADPGEEDWFELLPPQNMIPNTEHHFQNEVQANADVLWVRLNLLPDGGMARLRVWGDLSDDGYREARLLYLNSSSVATLGILFKQVCHADLWVQQMVESAPFQNQNDLLKKGAGAWAKCDEKDWLQALDGHPRIGQKAKGSALSAKWSRGEQSSAQAEDDVKTRLAQAQQQYFQKFGFIFLICASGRTSQEILDALEKRLPHSSAEEMQIVAEEQAKIIHLRLEKLLKS